MVVDELAPISFRAYLASSDFAVDVTDNWQSEYLQFFLYIFGTVWLLQRGSPESKEMHRAGPESDKDQRIGRHAAADSPAWARAGGWRQLVFSRSLGLVMASIFILSWLAQSIAGTAAYNEQRLRQLQAPIGWGSYLHSADLLEPDPAELAIRVPRRGLDGDPLGLPAPTRLTRIQASRRTPPRHRSGGLNTSASSMARSAWRAGCMNFAHMPELSWTYGYPLAIAVRVTAAGLLHRAFRPNGWL